MNPNNQSQSGGFTGAQQPGVQGQTPPSSAYTPQQQPTRAAHPQQQEAAISILRSQIDSLYGDQSIASPDPVLQSQPVQAGTHSPLASNPAPAATVATPAANTPLSQTSLQQDLQVESPYHRNHSQGAPQHSAVDTDQWKKYHSAWQDYYQKYYAAYYAHQSAKKGQSSATAPAQQPLGSAGGASNSQALPAQSPQQSGGYTGEVTATQAMQELRQRLLTKVQSRAQKVRKSRHFMPLIAALAVVLLFVFIQYNRVFIATVNAYVSPGSIDPQNIVINTDGSAIVGDEPRLIIPKINVDVPVVYGIGPDHKSQMKAMEEGIAHFAIPGANSVPGQMGNTVLSGHSSNDLFDRGDYKFIFAQLERLKNGDTIYANYEGTRYTYVVTKMEVVKPTQVDKLIYPTDTPVLTLITCTPLGTSLNRLLVTAEQISPSPSEASAAPSASPEEISNAAMPGNSATLLERLFGRE